VNSDDNTVAQDGEEIGVQMHNLITELYPICRSITGNGVRDTLSIISEHIPLVRHEVPSGTHVFDWTVPKEWNIRDAYIKDASGRKIVDFQQSNLHVVSYSAPVHTTLSLADLKEHLFTLPEHPEWIPYRTSYYKETWGFCLSHNQFLKLQGEKYEVCIDSSLEDGSLTYGDYFLPGESTDEVLVSCHVCHPSLCNDNLSGVALATFLAQHLTTYNRRYSYRFLFIPGTIGSIVWLSRNEERLDRIKHGLVLACVGDAGGYTYKKSRRGDTEIDAAVAHVLQHTGKPYEIMDFSPYGYDERQFCSPAFNLPVGCLMRTVHGRFPEYHTSADNLEFIHPRQLGEAFHTCLAILQVLEGNKRYINQNPKCEPQLGKRGLYQSLGGQTLDADAELALLWVLNLSDGEHALLDIARRSGFKFGVILKAAKMLVQCDLLRECHS